MLANREAHVRPTVPRLPTQSLRNDALYSPSQGDSPSATGMEPENKATLEDSKRKVRFENRANEKLEILSGYRNVAALLIKWDDDIDEFDHTSEIQELDKFFTRDLRYECKTVNLHTNKKPQNQLNAEISQHIVNHDGPQNLLIIYYTGHGFSKGSDKKLHLSAHQNPNEELGAHKATASWSEAEAHLLGSADSDVLVILDCCFASIAKKGTTNHTRTYQILAATSKKEMTCGPGERSFTTAFMKASRQLLEQYNGQPFPIIELEQKINIIRHEEAQAQVWNCLDGPYGVIQLAPLPLVKEGNTQEKKVSLPQEVEEKATLDIRFSLKDERLSEEQLDAFADGIADACKHANIDVRRVYWDGLKSSIPITPRLQTAVQSFLDVRRFANHWKKRTSKSRGVSPSVSPMSGPKPRADSFLTADYALSTQRFPASPPASDKGDDASTRRGSETFMTVPATGYTSTSKEPSKPFTSAPTSPTERPPSFG